MKTLIVTIALLTFLIINGCGDDNICTNQKPNEPTSANAFFEIFQGNTSIFARYLNDTEYFYFATDSLTVGSKFNLSGYTERTLHFNIMQTDWHYTTTEHHFNVQIPDLEPNIMYNIAVTVE